MVRSVRVLFESITHHTHRTNTGGPNTCALGCDVGYASTGYPPSYVCNVTNPEVKQSFACETERVCNCNHGTWCSSARVARLIFSSIVILEHAGHRVHTHFFWATP